MIRHETENILADESSSDEDDGKYAVGKNMFEKKLFELSKQFVSISDLREVGITGLNMPSHSVERHIRDSPNRLTSAAYSVLREWFIQQPDVETARKNMEKALRDTRKYMWIQIVWSEEQSLITTQF